MPTDYSIEDFRSVSYRYDEWLGIRYGESLAREGEKNQEPDHAIL